MTVKEIRKVICDTVCICQETESGDYEDIYKGSLREVPKELLDREVIVIIAKALELLDIVVENGQ